MTKIYFNRLEVWILLIVIGQTKCRTQKVVLKTLAIRYFWRILMNLILTNYSYCNYLLSIV
jgi:hypothetical protein